MLTHLIKTIFLAELYTLFPSIIAFVQVSCNTSEFNQLMLLQTLSQCDVIEVIIRIYGCSQALLRKENIRQHKVTGQNSLLKNCQSYHAAAFSGSF